MRIIILILFFFSGIQLYAQDYYALYNKAVQSEKSNKPDSAIHIYELIKKADSSSHKLWATYQLANFYYKNGRINEAEKEYRLALKIKPENNWLENFRHHSSMKLYELAMEKKEFPDALKYLRLANDAHRFRRSCGSGAYEANREMQFKFMKLFDQLKNPDSAISRFTAFAFDNLEYIYEYDTLGYKQMVNDYVSIIKKRYTPCEILSILENGVSHIIYNIKTNDASYWSLDCSFAFMSARVYLHHPGSWYLDKKDLENEYYKKEKFIENLKNSYGYKLIVNSCISEPSWVAK